MARMPDIIREAEEAVFGHRHAQPAATATAPTAQEAPGMSFAQSLREDAHTAMEVLARLGQAGETLAGDKHIDDLLEAALLATHVPAPVFEACVDMLNGAEARATATPGTGTAAAIAPPPAAPADAPAHDPRAPQDAKPGT